MSLNSAAANQAPIGAYSPVVTVIGGGQLARMMQGAAINLGITLRVLSVDPFDSAAQVIPDTVVGHHTNPEDLQRAALGCDAFTFDHEHVPTVFLEALQGQDVSVQPPPSALIHAQDKAVMRRRLTELNVPCPQWREVHTPAEIQTFAEDYGWPVVIKTPRGGYDGKGVAVLRSAADVAQIDPWFGTHPALLAEEFVAFDQEIAALVARRPSGEVAAWPVVQTVQKDGVCSEVLAPAPNLDGDLAEQARQIAITIATGLGVTGVLAVECFVTTDGKVLVNELAMRPHNSGHWTIEGSETSQFEQHLRAVLDLPLGPTTMRAPAVVMVNILGGTRPDLSAGLRHALHQDPGVKAHLYGKPVRPGRKVGHVTVMGDNAEQTRDRAVAAAAVLADENPA